MFGITGTSTGGEIDLVNPLYWVSDWFEVLGNLRNTVELNRHWNGSASVNANLYAYTNTSHVRVAEAYTTLHVIITADWDMMTYPYYTSGSTTFRIRPWYSFYSTSVNTQKTTLRWWADIGEDYVTFTRYSAPYGSYGQCIYSRSFSPYYYSKADIWTYLKGINFLAANLTIEDSDDPHIEDKFNVTITDFWLSR